MVVRPQSPLSSVAGLYRTGLDRTAKRLFPSYSRLSQIGDQQQYKHSTEISSSLPLQVLLYFNVWLFPVWAVGMVATMIWKIAEFYLEGFHKFLICFLSVTFILVETMRLWLGYKGNLLEKVPELSGYLLLTIFPQMVIALYFAFGQPYIGHGFATPFETGINVIYLCFLLPEVVWAYRAAQKIVKAQSARFFLTAQGADYQNVRTTREISDPSGFAG